MDGRQDELPGGKRVDNGTVSMPTQYGRILAPFDGSAGSAKALRRALILAGNGAAELTVFSVDEHLPRYAPAVGEIREEDDLRTAHFAELEAKVRAITAGAPRVVIETEVGHAAQAITRKAADGRFDLVVIGHSGHSGLWGSLLGSTAARVVEHASCDVLVVR